MSCDIDQDKIIASSIKQTLLNSCFKIIFFSLKYYVEWNYHEIASVFTRWDGLKWKKMYHGTLCQLVNGIICILLKTAVGSYNIL